MLAVCGAILAKRIGERMSRTPQKMLILLVASLVSVNIGNAKTMFHSETENGKKLEVQALGSFINYRFGDELLPELELTVPRELASTH